MPAAGSEDKCRFLANDEFFFTIEPPDVNVSAAASDDSAEAREREVSAAASVSLERVAE
ncbi:hypothetical protein [Bradyrhizobium sp.]|jgi:hypothetical protein|uniref:hypothetical protein n=1 Tax=Bradyrhizobium sp. TaxID=376 RepID=UPI003BB202BD